MSLHASYHADSDADDEYERSVITSPRLNTDSETSSTHSEPHSAEPTPTTTLLGTDERRPLKKTITQWTANDTADFITSLGLRQYCDRFVGECAHFPVAGPTSSDLGSQSQKMTLSGKLLSP